MTMAKGKRKNPLENIPKEHQHLEIEGGLEVMSSRDTSSALIEALSSPYEIGSTEEKIFALAKDSHASVPEIALILGESEKYLETEFKDVIERGYTACKILLRRQQLQSAKDGDSKQLTWLGKQILGQDDKITLDIPMTIVVDTGIRRES